MTRRVESTCVATAGGNAVISTVIKERLFLRSLHRSEDNTAAASEPSSGNTSSFVFVLYAVKREDWSVGLWK